jgi:hypothetical protein
MPKRSPNDPTPGQVDRAVRRYLRAGLSLIPIRADGTKMPAVELLPRLWCERSERWRRPWGGYRQRPPTPDELRAWLLARLVRVRTLRPGLHVYLRCDTAGGNQKLARVPDPAKDDQKPKTVIEVKGAGGYVLAPPSPAACHPTGRCYTLVGGNDLTAIPRISPDERQVLHDCARALDRCRPPQRQGYARRPASGRRLLRPGDDYNARADWIDVLGPHGWAWEGPGGDGTDLWRRPGKASFHAHALLAHGGDFHACRCGTLRSGVRGCTTC